MLASYARTETTLIIAGGGALTAAAGYFLGWWALAPAVLTLAALSFYRDPPRRIPAGDRLILAPADGKIVDVLRDATNDESDGREVRIVIFLSVANVHINRSPCAATVKAVQHRPGRFLNALAAESTESNERNELTLDPAGPLPGPIHVRQIAGALARRIVCVAQPGDTLAAGQRFGMIKLGSRTVIRLPEDPRWEIAIQVGDAVRAGRTVLARLMDR